MKGLNNIMKQAQALQSKMQEVQNSLDQERVTGSSGGGMVLVTANGKQDILSIKIDPQVINPADAEMLEDLIVAAVNQAREKAQALAQEKMQKIAGGLAIPGLSL
jgi:hypothetical protein